jgi:hypothetical protein
MIRLTFMRTPEVLAVRPRLVQAAAKLSALDEILCPLLREEPLEKSFCHFWSELQHSLGEPALLWRSDAGGVESDISRFDAGRTIGRHQLTTIASTHRGPWK